MINNGYQFRPNGSLPTTNLLEEFQTDLGRRLMRDYYRISVFPKKVANMVYMRGLNPINLNVKIQSAIGDTDVRKLAEDLKIVRNYVNSKKRNKRTVA